jgi:NADH-quinone oxidoreductase subunit F
VNNVETIAAVPTAIKMGGDAFSRLSSLHHFNDGGTRLFGVSGHVKRPGIYECAVGLTLRELIYELGGGILEDRQLLAVIPGGSSCPVHLPDEIVDVPGDERFAPYNGKSILDLPLGVDTFRAVGSMLGTCCAIVLSDAADPVLALHNLMRFYRHESCGQCTPCREGCGWIERILDKIIDGKGSIEELNQIHEIASNIMGNTICAFGDGAAQPALAFVRKFRKELEDYVEHRGRSQTGRLSL